VGAQKVSARYVAQAGWRGFLRGDRVVLPGARNEAWRSGITVPAARLLLPLARSALRARKPRATT
jgi:hypothetical protein